MEVASLHSFLNRHSHLALDTSIFIYQLEDNPHYVELTEDIFAWLRRPGNRAVTSAATMTELLVHPYRYQTQAEIDQYYLLLTTVPNLEWIPVGLEIADLAARLRAAHHLKTMDALQAATALHSGATGLITNDPAFLRVSGLQALVLGRLS